ncbi:MAG: hypothetical protein VW625_03830 [Perlucidibaca sp.]
MSGHDLLAVPFGAQLLQASLTGCNLFYLSPGPHQACAARRGGVPVLFPQFATLGPLPKHGFARNQAWSLLHAAAGHLLMRLDISPDGHPGWPHAARLLLEVVLGDGLRQSLRIENIGRDAFSFTGGLHPYWAVQDVSDCVVEGLPLSGLGRREVDEWHPGEGEITLCSHARRLRLTQSGFEGWQVWSPGPDHALRDLPHEDWRRFLCLEPVIMTPRWLVPGEVFEGVLMAGLI